MTVDLSSFTYIPGYSTSYIPGLGWTQHSNDVYYNSATRSFESISNYGEGGW